MHNPYNTLIQIPGSSPPKVHKTTPDRPVSVLSSRSSQIRSFSPFRTPATSRANQIYGNVTVHQPSTNQVPPLNLTKYRSGMPNLNAETHLLKLDSCEIEGGKWHETVILKRRVYVHAFHLSKAINLVIVFPKTKKLLGKFGILSIFATRQF